MPDPENSLVERCRRQDAEAFDRFVDLYQARVYGFVKRMVRDADKSADLSQEIFIRAYRSFPKFDGRSSVRTWLFRIACNLCVDHSRRNARGFTEVELGDSDDSNWSEPVDPRAHPEKELLDKELMRVVEEAIGSMSEKLRSVLLLHDQQDASYDEIAETLNVPVGTVKSRLFLARSHLQNAVQPYMVGEAE